MNLQYNSFTFRSISFSNNCRDENSYDHHQKYGVLVVIITCQLNNLILLLNITEQGFLKQSQRSHHKKQGKASLKKYKKIKCNNILLHRQVLFPNYCKQTRAAVIQLLTHVSSQEKQKHATFKSKSHPHTYIMHCVQLVFLYSLIKIVTS